MGDRKDQKPQGFAVVDPRWTAANLRTNDGAAGNSSYTEAGPEPGQMTLADSLNLGQLEISGGQTRTVEAIAARGGAPVAESVGIIWRLDGETADTDYRGWHPPNHPTWWEAVSTAVSVSSVSVCVIEKTQQPVALTETQVAVYNNTTSEWDRVVHSELTGAGLKSIMSVPGRLLVASITGLTAIEVFVSDDDNASWRQTVDARAPGATLGANLETADADIDPRTGQILLVAQGDDNTLYQYGSRDQGATWSFVGASVGNAGSVCQVRALPAGGFVVSIVTNLGFAVSRVVGSAFDLLGDIDPVQPFGATTTAADERRRHEFGRAAQGAQCQRVHERSVEATGDETSAGLVPGGLRRAFGVSAQSSAQSSRSPGWGGDGERVCAGLDGRSAQRSGPDQRQPHDEGLAGGGAGCPDDVGDFVEEFSKTSRTAGGVG